MKNIFLKRAFIGILLLSVVAFSQKNKYKFNDPSLSVDERVNDILSHLTLEEKAGFMSGETMWYLHGVKRLGIPQVQVTDCGHGVTVIFDNERKNAGCATSFPTAIAQGASWDKELVYRVGAAIGRETRDLGSAILLAPMVNIHRLPIGGRNYETFSEDPFLSGKMAASFINGVQSEHIGAVVKSITAYNQQKNSRTFVKLSERALREIYLPAFRIAINESNPWGLMTAYNGINEYSASESQHLLTEIVKNEWNYEGFIVSDWRAVKSGKSLPAGVDIEMPGPGKFMDSKHILQAINDGVITEKELDERISRYLRALVKSKLLDIPKAKLNSESNTLKHQKLAREMAEGSIVLLKNRNNLLPLDENKISTIAVFGPNAEEARLGGGGSASVTACYSVSPLDGLRKYFGKQTKITFFEGVALKGGLPIIQKKYLTTEYNGETLRGLRGEYFLGKHLKGKIKCTRIDDKIDFSWGWAAPCENVNKNNYSVRWSGKIHAPVSGTYKIGVSVHEGGVRLYLDGKLVIDEWGNPDNETTEDKFVVKSENVKFFMEKGSAHNIKVEFHKKHNKNAIRLEWEIPGMKDPIKDVVKLAKQSEVSIVFAGLSNLIEGGNNDRPDIVLPGNQDKLISAVAKANPNTIVVLINGTPVAMPWINEVAAVLEAFYPGQEGGNAIANVLSGKINPSGKLPDTYAVKMEDYLSMKYYPGDVEKGISEYGEELKVGYRQFDEDKIEPLFPFGFGLSYTTFKVANIKVNKVNDKKVIVKVDVTNTGKVTGAEVVQVYVSDVEASVYRPKKELKGFEKIMLNPGETKTAIIELDKFAFSFFSEKENRWVLEPGEFKILVGNSSREIITQAMIKF